MKYVGLIGYPLKHSLSPAFQQAAFDYLGLEIVYEAWETAPKDIPSVVERLRNKEYLGMNVTVPHKETVMTFLDDIDLLAEQIGAVNTVVKIEDRLKGYNTDAIGFLKALRQEGHFGPEGKKVVVLGAGGAARAVTFSLAQAGASQITICNRNLERAQNLAGDLRKVATGTGAIATAGKEQVIESLTMSGPEFVGRIRDCDLLVNCTSVGMSHSAGDGISPIGDTPIRPETFVYDLVYTPAETPLIRSAISRGATALGGLPMLVYQGAAAFELWTGKAAPVDIMMSAAVKALSERDH